MLCQLLKVMGTETKVVVDPVCRIEHISSGARVDSDLLYQYHDVNHSVGRDVNLFV